MRVSRRSLLLGGAGAVGVGAVGAAGWQLAPYGVKQRLGATPDPFIPDAAEGRVRLESVHSPSLGGAVDLFTAVPAGHRDGAGLPVVLVLHGSSASAAERLVYAPGAHTRVFWDDHTLDALGWLAERLVAA